MLTLYRDVVRFFAECLEALHDEEPPPERYEQRQQRWLDYLKAPDVPSDGGAYAASATTRLRPSRLAR